MKWAGKPKRVKITFNGRTERGKYIKPFCPEQEERKRNDPNGGGWSPQLNTFGASVLRYPTIAHGKAALRFERIACYLCCAAA
jgi:hypothetical protein